MILLVFPRFVGCGEIGEETELLGSVGGVSAFVLHGEYEASGGEENVKPVAEVAIEGGACC